jgi:hypothetical protein
MSTMPQRSVIQPNRLKLNNKNKTMEWVLLRGGGPLFCQNLLYPMILYQDASTASRSNP